MAMFFVRLMDDGAVEIIGKPWGGSRERVHSRFVISRGDEFILPYEELIQYGWFESTDAGLFARGGKPGTFPFV